MQATMKLCDDLIHAWQYTREGITAEFANIPDARFNEKPQGIGRSALDLANHVVESGRLMAGELSRPDGDFMRKPYPDLITEHSKSRDYASTKAEALDVLRRSHKEDEEMLRRAGPDLLMEPIRQFNGENAIRLAWMHHGIAHEEYHRGQVALFARLFGETPALTKLIYGINE